MTGIIFFSHDRVKTKITSYTQHLETDRCLRRFGDLDLLLLRSKDK